MQSFLAVVSVHKLHKILTCWADGLLTAHENLHVVVMHLLRPAHCRSKPAAGTSALLRTY